MLKNLKKLRKRLPSRRAVVRSCLLAAICALAASSYTPSRVMRPKSIQELAQTTVKITNPEKNSGGSGVILHSSAKGSEILTNRHVCELTAHGGWATTRKGSYAVIAIKPSEQHDLCLVQVAEDLGLDTVVAEKDPAFGDAAIVSGHPRLYPHMVARGTFTDREEVSIMIGSRPCTAEEFEKRGLACIFGMPTIKKYDAQYISGLVLPGNSGSAVFNSDGEIAAVVFASGSRELHYGIVVPHPYVKLFIDSEAPNKNWQPITPAPKDALDEQGAE